MTEPVFSDRRRAGLCLAESLTKYANRDDVIVLGVPRGGVPVAFEVAKLLRAPLDVIIVRKLGVPGYEELAMGAIASGGSQFIHETVMRALGVSPAALAAAIETETKELRRRELVYRGHAGTPAIKDRIVILIDDGVATGSALRSAILAVRAQQPQKLIVAAPVASYEAFTEIKAHADDLIALIVPMDFRSVGQWYEDFQPTSDEEITDLLRSRTDELIT